MKEEFVHGKSTAEIFREAIAANGPVEKIDAKNIKAHIDAHYSNFPWMNAWESQVAGAIAGEATRFMEKDEQDQVIRISHLEAAQEFVEQVGGGSMEHAFRALGFLETLSYSYLKKMGNALDIWSKLVTAVGGDPDTAAKALGVLSQHRVSPSPSQQEDSPLRLRRAA